MPECEAFNGKIADNNNIISVNGLEHIDYSRSNGQGNQHQFKSEIDQPLQRI